MQIGCAAADISPTPGLPLSGFAMRRNRPSVAVDDTLLVKVLLLEDGGRLFVLLSYDLIAFDRTLDADIHALLRETLGERYCFDRSVITTTHTHSGPPTMPIAGETRAPDSYIDRLLRATGQAVRQAVVDLGDAQLFHACRVVEGLTIDRRGDSTPIDQTLDLFVFKDAAGRAVAGMVRFACHGVTMGNLHASADFSGELTRRIGNQIEAPCLFLQGVSGDVDPITRAEDHAAMVRFVDRLMEQTGGMVDALRPIVVDGLAARSGSADIPYAPLPTEMEALAAIEKNDRLLAGDRASADLQPLIAEYLAWRMPEDNDLDAVIDHWAVVYKESAQRTLAVVRSGEAPAPLSCRVVVWRMGGFAFVFIAGEVLSGVGRRIQALLPGEKTQVVGFLSPVVGYLCGPEVSAAGGYEASGAWLWYRQPGPFAADMQTPLLEEVARLLETK